MPGRGITSTAFLRRMSSSTSQFTDEVDAERAPMSAPPPPLRGRVTEKGKGGGAGDAGGLGFSREQGLESPAWFQLGR